MLVRSCSAVSNMAGVILALVNNSPRCDIHAAEFPRPGQFIALQMLHAVMREMPDVERIGEIIEISQLVRNLEFSGLFRHRNTSKAYLLVDSKRHQYNIYTGVQDATNFGTEAVMNHKAALPHPRIFYGWFVVAAAFAVTFVGFGCAYTFSAFVESLQRDFGASRGSVSLVFSLAGFLYFGLGIVSGPLADRFGSRRLAVAGMILTGLGLAAASVARSLTEVYAAYGLGVGLGVGCAYVPAIGAVQRWFVRRRGFASGLAVSGIGVGTLVMPPLASLLIETLGWRGAYLALGALAAVVRRRTGAPDRERSARPRPRSRRRSAAIGRPAGATGRRFRERSDPVTPLHQPVCRLPDLLVRRVRAVRPSRALCRGSRRCAPRPPCCCSA